MVDTERHPLPPTIPTEGENAPDLQDLHWTTKAALVLLAVFVLALPLAGLLGVVHGHPLGVGFLGLAISTLTASILLGAE